MTTWVCLTTGSLADLARRSWPLMPRWTTRTSPPSRRNRRYFPRRTIPSILRPSSRLMKSFFDLWRRIERRPVASTVLIFLPETSFSRSRRIVSTSGSSGIGRHLGLSLGRCRHLPTGASGLGRRPARVVAGRDLRQLLPGDAGGRLLGLLL